MRRRMGGRRMGGRVGVGGVGGGGEKEERVEERVFAVHHHPCTYKYMNTHVSVLHTSTCCCGRGICA